MARLGELLVAARLLDQDQIERALQAQVLWGGRLGTNLIELGLLDLDGISRALGRQHGLPAALARHFDKADRELQDRLPEELARRWSVVPLLHVGAEKKKIAVAVLDPLPADALAELADALLCEPAAIVASVAAEMRVRYHLERIYGVARPSRYLRSRGKSVTPFPQFDNVPVPIDSDAEVAVPIAVDESAHPTGVAEVPVMDPPVVAEAPPGEADPPRRDLVAEARAAARLATIGDPAAMIASAGSQAPGAQTADEADDLAALIDDAIARATAIEPTVPIGRDRRTYVRTLADDLPAPSAVQPNDASVGDHSLTPAPASVVSARTSGVSLGRVAIKRVGPEVAKPATRSSRLVVAPTTLVEATRAIRRSTDRDRVAALVMDALGRFVPVCEAAILLVVRGDVALSWKQFSRTCEAPGDIAVPLDQPGLIPTVIERNTVARAAVGELGPIDEALVCSVGELQGDLVVVPLAIADRVLCLIAAVTPSDASVEGVEAVAAAAATAFARLIRDASR